MKLMLGFARNQAEEYAKRRGWTALSASRRFRDESGEIATWCRGSEPGDRNQIVGLQIDEIIWGPLKVDDHIAEYARSMVRLSGVAERAAGSDDQVAGTAVSPS